MSASPTLVAFRPKRFHCRTTAKILVYIKYAKNENHLGNVRNSKRTRKHQDVLSDCNGTRTHNHLVRKRTLNHLAKLTKLTKKYSS